MIKIMFSDYKGVKLKINNTRKFIKFTNIRKLNSTLLNNQCIKEEITRNLENTLSEKIKAQHSKYRMQLKQCLEINLQLQMPILKKKGKKKPSNQYLIFALRKHKKTN